MNNRERRRRELRRQEARRRAARAAAGVAVLALVVAVVVSLALSGNDNETAGGEAAASAVGGAVPSEQLETLDGSTFSLTDFRGTPMVVNFFASWCVPCLAEMPGFEQVHQQLGDEVTFVGLNLQDDVGDGLRVVDETGITYTVGRDPSGALFEQFGGFAMPTTVFIDAEGTVVELQSGEISAGELESRIDGTLLG